MAQPIEWSPPIPQWRDASDDHTGSELRDQRTAAILGVALGLSFGVCFATGLYSHWAQSTDPIVAYPARPAGLYRITQGLHVFSGVLAIPLLLAKLWVVLPKFFRFPPAASIAHAVERLALLPLVGGGIFMLLTGFNNIAAWYPWEFNFVVAHYWAAWITIGGLIVHVGAKATTTRRVLADDETPPIRRHPHRMQRRGFLGVIGATAIFLAASVSAQTVRPFRVLGLFAPRDLRLGPQSFPVNSSARRRGVVDAAMSSDYRLRVTGAVDRELSFTLDDLRAMDLHEAELPIACVEGWSKSARWRGVRVRDLLAEAGAPEGASCTTVSLQERGAFRTAYLNADHASDPDTLLALEINGETLHIDHGFPVRLIGPNRPGVNQTKWVTEVRVT